MKKWVPIWCVILLQIFLVQKVEAQASTDCEAVLTAGSQPAILALDRTHAAMWVSVFQKNLVMELSLYSPKCGVIRTVGTGVNPYGVTFDGTYIWVTNNGSNTVTKIDASNGQVVATIGVGVQPRGIVWDGGGYIFVANYGSNSVTVIDFRTNLVLKTITVGHGPYVLAVNSVDLSVWIPNRNSNTVSVIPHSLIGVSSFATDGEPQFAAADNLGNMWVSCYSGGTVLEFSQAGSLLRRVNVTANGHVGGPTGITFAALNGGLLWGAANSGYVYSVDSNGNVGNVTFRGGSGHAHIGITWSGGTNIWSADTGGSIIEDLIP